MRHTRLVRVQLALFTVCAILGIGAIGVYYAQIPQSLGIGRYTVTVELADGAGLYPNANVAYRGTTIGKVESLTMTAAGATATLSLESAAPVPADLDASVRSMSAIGEQYVDLAPRRAGGPQLADGDVITADRTSLPEDIGPLLDQLEAVLDDSGLQSLRSVLDESNLALQGTGPQLAQGADALIGLSTGAAGASADLGALLDDSAPLLDAQLASSDAIAGWARSMSTFTTHLSAADSSLRGVLEHGGPAAAETSALLTALSPEARRLLPALLTVAELAKVYNASIEQILVLYPAIMATTQSAGLPNVDDPGQNTFFVNELNDPPPCITGFLPPAERRSPTETDVPATPRDLFCKLSQDSPIAVRGARNLPCQENPGRRAPTVALCQDPVGFVPEG
ncbi:MCE family protein [Tomitella biformata]|uniref:MCE family protein n=1 Tax=Tomitella biformata TaxID=630403 RepID=UPI000465CC1A|nr:MlaD family protein [Tomitella biformata]